MLILDEIYISDVMEHDVSHLDWLDVILQYRQQHPVEFLRFTYSGGTHFKS